MNFRLLKWAQALSLCVVFLMISCSDDDTADIQTDPDNPTVAEFSTIIFDEENPTNNKPTASASGMAGSIVQARVLFNTTDTKQRRMYITLDSLGQGVEPFIPLNISDDNIKGATKADGSIDLEKKNTNMIDFTFDLPVPQNANGVLTYNIWTTTGRGDFRDPTKRRALGVGTITVTVGDGTNPNAMVREFDNVELMAPLADGTSETFVSLLDTEKVFTIEEGAEVAALWDFGYFYGNTLNASLASANNYPDNIVNILTVANGNMGSETVSLTKDDLNTVYFSKSTDIDSDGFDKVQTSADLNSFVRSDVQRVTNLMEGDVIEFVDSFGKKGLIRVESLTAGAGTNGQIVIDIKVQP